MSDKWGHNPDYIKEYNKEHYYSLKVRLPKDYQLKLQLAAAKSGCKSIAEFIRKSIDDALERDPQE